MAQPNAGTPAAAPAAGQAPANAAEAAKTVAKPGESAAPGTPVENAAAAAEAAKTANPIEAEVAAAFGEDWEKMTPKARERVIASEMKVREADKRMQLVAKLKKDLDMTTAQTGQLIEALKKDPWKVLSNPALGHDVRKLAEQYVWTMIEQQRMTPEQKEAADNKTKLAEYEAREKERVAAEEKVKQDALISERRAYWEKTISEAIDAEKLPKTSYVVRRFAEYVKAAVRQRQPADMPSIAREIRQELVELQSKFLLPPRMQGETDDAYEERVLASAPNDYIKLLRKADLKKLRASGKLPKPGPRPVGGVGAAPVTKKKSMTEWLNERDQRMGR